MSLSNLKRNRICWFFRFGAFGKFRIALCTQYLTFDFRDFNWPLYQVNPLLCFSIYYWVKIELQTQMVAIWHPMKIYTVYSSFSFASYSKWAFYDSFHSWVFFSFVCKFDSPAYSSIWILYGEMVNSRKTISRFERLWLYLPRINCTTKWIQP